MRLRRPHLWLIRSRRNHQFNLNNHNQLRTVNIKEDWFPIYIRGVKDIDEDKLKNHLTKKFGEIKFFRVFVNIALCDFVEGDAQKKALEAKETEVDGYVIQLEVRESKTHTGNKANIKNPKDKVSNGTTNEKRGRNDKKQNSKKNRSSSRNLD